MAMRDMIAEFTRHIYRRVPAIQKIVWVPGVHEIETQAEGFPPSDSISSIHGLVASHDGRLVHKWLHYLEIYDHHFAPFRKLASVRVLEIGVSHGGFLEILRKYFGERAILFGIDIDPKCAALDGNGINIRIGSQADPSFLNSVIDEMGGVDLIIDDGSHIAQHQNASLEILFPRLAVGGVFIVEDTHTAYWPGHHRGGFRREHTIIENCKSLVDHLHRWHHARGERASWKDEVKSVHFYDSMIVIDKDVVNKPRHAKKGKPSFLRGE
jgi:23S rRNA U2552 (ribose-2'-O)-methylase RlmE/FtsJ